MDRGHAGSSAQTQDGQGRAHLAPHERVLAERVKEGRKEGTQTSRDPEGRRLPATATLLGPRGPSSSDRPGLQAAQ